jgi:flagellar biosynthetic protein FliQ
MQRGVSTVHGWIVRQRGIEIPDAARCRQGLRKPATLKEGCGMQFDLSQATDLIRSTLLLALIVSTPMLVIGVAVGVIISVLQAVTQIQEQTLTFVPKIIAMISAVIVLFPWMGHYLMEYAAQMFGPALTQ